ncbi:hypothetical protein MUY27_04230 [Mucilaginibacter sp. RS28]|uniref:Uncharacterized protein n=1 Tax=Mucilaginibacter straminoryzae TaxID=2932774 RepID=A0A9X1X3D7_9SPHI|nr:hypothetical protein [Mucilaginibacter straminoryzae]MCJ8208903.1 hypothetical protein [Mucilaginibacter straminoryzae]
MLYLRKLAYSALVTFVPFVILAWLLKQLFPYQLHPQAYPNEFTFTDLRVYFSHVMPLLYVAALLLNGLYVEKLVKRFFSSAQGERKKQLLTVAIVIIIFSVILSILIWSPEAGLTTLLRSVSTCVTIQAIYWLLTAAMLFTGYKLHAVILRNNLYHF